ncbi:MAG: acetyl-CoA carboxylase biotin carboxylase subunit [Actinomycetia bacterium]|nr:acetyl-CoA carboxylase biotin carboxylase subunit [Actinomycetes bacterium]
MFDPVLIANRGEVAVRVIRACRELGIGTVAVYSTADADSEHVRMADLAVCIGPPQPAESYLNIASVIAAATTTGCGAVHPGWGFLAEHASFARACEDNGLVFIGPTPEAIEVMGDKIRARSVMSAAGVPVVPGSPGPVDLSAAAAFAEEVGYPVLLKATAGGGGRGMRLVEDASTLADAYTVAAGEAEAAFSSADLYIEKALLKARHVEVQVVCDGAGAVATFGERDCSVQRRHQKLIEEAPSPGVSAAMRASLEETARGACLEIGYRGAGTLEFLAVPGDAFFFIEMNTRLQVEHPVTELITGVDLVHAQLAIAAGEGLPAELGSRRGHALEVRINAEDPARNFMPTPGTIERFRPPLGPGVRVDTHIVDGYVVPPFYDSLLAKVIVHAADRQRALERAVRALNELEIVGVPTTREFAIEVLQHPQFASGNYTTQFLELHGPELVAPSSA